MREHDDFTPIALCLIAMPTTEAKNETRPYENIFSDYEYRPDYVAVDAEFRIYNPSREAVDANYYLSLTDERGELIARKRTHVLMEQGQTDGRARTLAPFGHHAPTAGGLYKIRLTDREDAEESLLEKAIRLTDLHGMKPEEVYTIEEAFVTDGHECVPRRVYAEADGPYEYMHAVFSSPLNGHAHLPELWALVKTEDSERLEPMTIERFGNREDICPDPSKTCASILLPNPYNLDTYEGKYTVSFICLGRTIGTLTCGIGEHTEEQGKWLKNHERDTNLIRRTIKNQNR